MFYVAVHSHIDALNIDSNGNFYVFNEIAFNTKCFGLQKISQIPWLLYTKYYRLKIEK